MSTEIKKEVKLKIGHVLFMDIVGYSKLLINEQRARRDKLNQLVRSTQTFREADTGTLIKSPTGDGMALVFPDPEQPVECALEISRLLKTDSELPLRMGIHSGPATVVTDVNDTTSVAGAGINVAQRVMDCGDAGHILISKHVAEDLEQYAHWKPLLHDLGECEVKHGVRVGIVNFYSDGIGNSRLPRKIQLARQRRRRGRLIATATGLSTLAIVIAGILVWRQRAGSNYPEKSIAILPFESLSEEKANVYFAEGIQTEILGKLAIVSDLKVISRTSTAKYQSKPDNLKKVGQELGVSTILEGTVQKAGDKVRVSVQLLDAREDRQLWADSYDRDFKDVLGVESEISKEIVDALRAKLSPGESQALASIPTQNSEAYDLYLRAEYEFRQAEGSLNPESQAHADALFQQALERDPRFAQAAAEQTRSRLWRHWFISPLAPAELEKLKTILDQAAAQAPKSPEVHLARGAFFYWGHRQYEMALAEFKRTLELQPNNAVARQYCGWIYRRRGEWDLSLKDSKRAQALDPQDSQIPANIGLTYQALRQWKDSERAELRALAINPHNAVAAPILITTRLNGTGDIKSARKVLEGFPDGINVTPITGAGGFNSAGNVAAVTGIEAYLDVLERRYTDALKAFDKKVGNDDQRRLWYLTGRVAILVLGGQAEAAKSAAEEALPLLEEHLKQRPDETFTMTELSWVYLALGRNADALRLSRQAADSISPEVDALAGPSFQSGLAQIEARAGAPDEAVKTLRRLLSTPTGYVISIASLKIDPVWDPIRNRSDFQQLLSGSEHIGPLQ